MGFETGAFSGRLDLLLNDGQGKFELSTVSESFSSPRSVRFYDINQDGSMDIYGGTRSSLNVWINNGDLVFGEPITFFSGTSISGHVYKDIDGDGNFDFLLGLNSDSATWLKNESIDPLVFSEIKLGVIWPGFAVDANDMDGDGDIDGLVSNGDLVFFKNNINVTSINLFDQSIAANIFPNPFKESIFVDVEHKDKLIFHIFDMNGRLIITSKDQTIHLNDFPPGQFILKISNFQTGKLLSHYSIVKQ